LSPDAKVGKPKGKRIVRFSWPPKVPEGIADCIKVGIDIFASTNLGEEWCTLLHSYLKFEKECGTGAGLSTAVPARKQPEEITKWIQNGRQMQRLPAVSRVHAYALEVEEWYQAMQPSWREAEEDGRLFKLNKRGKGWGGLKAPGPNGITTLLVSLYILGLWAEKKKVVAGSGIFTNVCIDLAWMLDGMVMQG
jgi:hypothetical protein